MSPLGDPNELLEILRNNQLTSVFQPIVDLQRTTLFGYEALTRGPANSTLHSPLALFDTASRHGLMGELEYACREVACKNFVHADIEGKLFINISPMSLTETGYKSGMTNSIIDRLGLPAERIVIELSEQYPLDDYQMLRKATDHFRDEGFQIAIDDLGAGYAGLRAWSELQPDYVKIDRHFIEHINRDPIKREFVRSIQEIASELGCRVVAEGIETREELNTVQEMGLQYGQGYFIGRPEISPETVSRVLDRVQAAESPLRKLHRISHTVEEMTLTSPSIKPSLTLDETNEVFHKNRNISCLPVVEEGMPIGIVERQNILELFSQRYTRELHGRKPISEFMNETYHQVSHNTTLEEVSRLLTENNTEQLTQNFVITRHDQYYGIGKTSTLLKRITDLQIRNARYANPLTLLPGNVPLHEKLDELLRMNASFHIAYVDLDSFKPFNDHYGYSAGDEVIIALSKVLHEKTDKDSDFVSHVGGDDFVIIFERDDWRDKCEAIIDRFSSIAPEFYCEGALKDGGIWGVSRSGEKQFYDLISISIGIANPDSSACSSFHDVSALAVEAKREAKRRNGNAVFVSRRRQPQSIKA